MKEILVWRGKHSTEYWDVSTPSLKAGAFLGLFQQVDDCGYYDGLKPPFAEERKASFPENHPEGCRCNQCSNVRTYLKNFDREQEMDQRQRNLYQDAREGNADAAFHLLKLRNNYEYEYEQWSIEKLNAPGKEKA